MDSLASLASFLVETGYMISVVFFILGMKWMSHPASARKGNFTAAAGMLLAVLATLLLVVMNQEGNGNGINFKGNFIWIGTGLLLGSVVGLRLSARVKMTDMPQMVSLLNGFGGAAAMLVVVAEVLGRAFNEVHGGAIFNSDSFIALPGVSNTVAFEYLSAVFYNVLLMVNLIAGAISFSGSIMAMGKLQGFVPGGSVRWPFQRLTNNGLLVLMLAGILLFFQAGDAQLAVILGLCAAALLFGVLFVLPIGGADMPVVISLLNSITGLTSALTGFMYDNQAMVMGGVLVGASGLLLTILMCRAMNRSLGAVLLGAFQSGRTAASDRTIDTTIRETSMHDAAVLMAYARRVAIIPGYGLAVAQAQHAVHELELQLEARGVEVTYGIHPVAGRMPGHMNVLLAESDVSYDKLLEMERINPEFPRVDVVLVIGANDVVNPAAERDPASPIYGMPILQVDRAAAVLVVKRSMNAGYAGIENELFYDPKTRMLFGDAKSVLQKLNSAIKEV
jgi:NAD(P) transhydrogenase subunit beta